MANLNYIGLDAKKSGELAEKLNVLLANYQVFYNNARGYHWNIQGDKFFELHLKFEELYNDLFLKIDEIAERILTLGHVPYHAFSDFSKLSTITEQKNVSDGKTAVQQIQTSIALLIKLERELLTLAADTGDEGTNALMSDYIRQQEKLSWMYAAYLGR